MSFKDTFKQLVNEVAKIGSDYYSGDRYEEPNAFAYWFCKAALSIDPDDYERIKRAVTNGPADQNFDIIFINPRNTTAFAVQTKYSKNLNSKNEGQNDINALVKNAKRILQDREQTFNTFKNTCRPDMQSKVGDLFKAVRSDSFKLKFIYVTTSRISEAKKKSAQDDFEQLRGSENLSEEDLELLFYEGSDVCKVYKNYAVLAAMDEISAAHNNAPLSAIALAWLRSQPTVSAPISSARTVAQLEEIVQVIHLTSDEVEKLNTLSA
jgi:hypothetical protein